MDPDERSELWADMHEIARGVAREEVASFAGLILRRLQDVTPEGLPNDPDPDLMVTVGELRSIFGEVLADFSGHTGSGEEPGE